MNNQYATSMGKSESPTGFEPPNHQVGAEKLKNFQPKQKSKTMEEAVWAK